MIRNCCIRAKTITSISLTEHTEHTEKGWLESQKIFLTEHAEHTEKGGLNVKSFSHRVRLPLLKLRQDRQSTRRKAD